MFIKLGNCSTLIPFKQQLLFEIFVCYHLPVEANTSLPMQNSHSTGSLREMPMLDFAVGRNGRSKETSRQKAQTTNKLQGWAVQT